MNTEIALNNIVNYFCDILELPEAELPGRLEGHWNDVLKLANDQNVYLYLVAWMLEHWNSDLTDSMKERFARDMEWNRARNVRLLFEIQELAELFNDAGIPSLFLKGSAGLVRGIHSIKCRYISDIDVLIKHVDKENIVTLMKDSGYETNNKHFFKNHHHLAPYNHKQKIGSIEIHLKPYHHFLNNYIIDDLWSDSEIIQHKKGFVKVPNATDHIWILIRKELLGSIFNPRLNDLIELCTINDSFSVDMNTLINRSRKDNLPNLLNKSIFYASKFIDNNLKSFNSDSLYPSFQNKVINHCRRLASQKTIRFTIFLSFIAAIRYFSDPGILSKARTTASLIKSSNAHDMRSFLLP